MIVLSSTAPNEKIYRTSSAADIRGWKKKFPKCVSALAVISENKINSCQIIGSITHLRSFYRKRNVQTPR